MPRINRTTLALAALFLIVGAAVIVSGALYYRLCESCGVSVKLLTTTATVSDDRSVFGEPFGIATNNGEIYVSDGMSGKIMRIDAAGEVKDFASGLQTPSAIVFDKNGDLIVADTGSHTIKRIDGSGKISILAGIEGQIGDLDGPAASTLFNAPIGLAVMVDGSIVVADTYNDKIKLIKDDVVTTLAGSTRGFAEGVGAAAKFDTPCGVAAIPTVGIIVADTLNSRLRLISPDGTVSTLAGGGDSDVRDGTLGQSAFYRPFAVSIGRDGSVFVADNNALRMIKKGPLPIVETITDQRRGFADGPVSRSRFNRISGIAVNDNYDLILTDSDNAAVRKITSETNSKSGLPEYVVKTKRTDPAEFRARQSARWPYDPPDAKRDIAGTLGEIRGELVNQTSQAWFHNGLDIAGGYGEKAHFIRDEKVLNPISVDNFSTLRELIRMPTIGYIHIRLGRDSADKPFGDSRFHFDSGMTGVRVRRGSEFRAGEVIGTLNAMNHVHMIAGPSGDEMNALAALVLPGVNDTTPPVVGEVEFFDQNWNRVETNGGNARITLADNIRIVVRAFDRMDGNPERRRLGVYRVGYQILNSDRSPLTEINWNISFDRNPSPDAVKFAYAVGSKSGATGETVFRYIVTNKVNGDSFSEGFFDTKNLAAGGYVIRAFAADYFGNTTTKDISFEVAK